MSQFNANVVASSVKEDQPNTPSIEVLVGTGSELTWRPVDAMQAAGISAVRRRSFQTATGRTIAGLVGYAILRAAGFETIDEVVLAEPCAPPLLGVCTLEGFGVMVDDLAHRLVATATIVAGVGVPFSPNIFQ